MQFDVSTVVEPFALPGVKSHHLPGIFGEFSAVVKRRIAELEKEGKPPALKKIAFFEFLLGDVDAERYGAIQREYLALGAAHLQPNTVKYLDPINWFESKFSVALRLGLDGAAPKRILDLGTGPGHFPVVARFLGHDVLGTELPARVQAPGSQAHLYDLLCDLYRVKRIAHRIRPDADLHDLPGGFDLVTTFLAAFNVDARKQPWSVTHWNRFMQSLRTQVLVPGGHVHLNLADEKLTPEAWSFLVSKASWSVDHTKSAYFESLDGFRAVTDGTAAH